MSDLGGLDRVATNERRVIEVRPSELDTALELECECNSAFCDRRIALTRADYEPLRSSAARYAVCPDEAHVDPDVDRVIEQHRRYWVVERRPSLELIDFYSSRESAAVVELSTRSGDSREPDGTA
jgi:hypothetical protein